MRDGKRQYSAMNVLALVLSAVVPVPFPGGNDNATTSEITRTGSTRSSLLAFALLLCLLHNNTLIVGPLLLCRMREESGQGSSQSQRNHF
jgi:hypothetical protein